MSHIITMAMTTIPPVMVVSSGLSSISSVTMAASLMGLPATSGQHEVVLLPPLMLRCPSGDIGLASATAATSIFNASSGLCQLCYGFSTGRFSFSELSLLQFCMLKFGVHYGVCFYFQVPMGVQLLVFAPVQPFEVYPMAGICASW